MADVQNAVDEDLDSLFKLIVSDEAMRDSRNSSNPRTQIDESLQAQSTHVSTRSRGRRQGVRRREDYHERAQANR